MIAARIALAAALLAPSLARAGETTAATPAAAAPAPPSPPDRSAVEAGDANLEPVGLRQGIVISGAIGGSASVGFGMSNATGRGGALTLRLGNVANAHTIVAVEVLASALFFSVSGELYQTNVSNFLASGQFYVNPALWFRAGLGFGRYGGDELRIGDAVFRERFRYAGPAGSAGVGIDVLRLRVVRAHVEFSSTAMLNRDGVLLTNGLLVGVSFE